MMKNMIEMHLRALGEVRRSFVLCLSLSWFLQFSYARWSFLPLPRSLGHLDELYRFWFQNQTLCIQCCQCTHQGSDWEPKLSCALVCILWWVIDFVKFDFELNIFSCPIIHLEYMLCSEKRVCLSCGVCRWRMRLGGQRRNWTWVGDLVQRIGSITHKWVLGGQTIGSLGGVKGGLHHTHGGGKENGFDSFCLKTTGNNLLVWALKPATTIF